MNWTDHAEAPDMPSTKRRHRAVVSAMDGSRVDELRREAVTLRAAETVIEILNSPDDGYRTAPVRVRRTRTYVKRWRRRNRVPFAAKLFFTALVLNVTAAICNVVVGAWLQAILQTLAAIGFSVTTFLHLYERVTVEEWREETVDE
jgi:hypothetical protein